MYGLLRENAWGLALRDRLLAFLATDEVGETELGDELLWDTEARGERLWEDAAVAALPRPRPRVELVLLRSFDARARTRSLWVFVTTGDAKSFAGLRDLGVGLGLLFCAFELRD